MDREEKLVVGIMIAFLIFIFSVLIFGNSTTQEEYIATQIAENGWEYRTYEIGSPGDALNLINRLNGVKCVDGVSPTYPCYYGDLTWTGTPFTVTWFG